MRKRICWLMVALAGVVMAGCGPRSYEDCVLDHIDDASSQNAALLVARACRNKFPLQPGSE